MSVKETLTTKLGGSKSLKAGLGYTVGNILVRGISFITLPIFSRLMTQEQFGVFNVFLSYEAFLFVIVGLALHSSIKSANLEYPGKIDEYTSSVSIIYWINFVILMLIAGLLGKHVAGIMGIPYPAILMLVMYSFGSAIVTLFNERISINYSYKKYMVVALINSVGNVGVSLILMMTLFKESMDIGRIVGATVVFFLLGVGILITFYMKARPRFNRQYIKWGIKYSAPIIPHGISQVLLGQCDRVMIRYFISEAATGVYSLAGTINLVMTVISASIDTAWSAWFFGEMKENRIDNVKKRAIQLSLLFTILGVGLLGICPELIWILGGSKYAAATAVAVPLIIDSYLLFLYNIIIASEYYKKKTGYIMAGTLIAAVVNVILNYIFIQKYGYVAAAYTTLFSYMLYLIIHEIISRRIMGFFVLSPWQIIKGLIIMYVFGVVTFAFEGQILIRYAITLVGCALLAFSLYKKLKKQGGT